MSNRVLVVDCDRAASVVTAQLLTAAGYLSDVADSFENALNQLARQCPDLLVTAVRLGQFNGLHLVMRCRAEHPTLPIVVTADQTDTGLAREAEQYGAKFVDKAADPQRFVRLIGELLPGVASA